MVNLHSSYKITDNIELFGLVRNLFDQHYSIYGTLFDIASLPYLNLTDPRTFLPGMPLAVYVGIRGTLPGEGQVLRPIVRRRYRQSAAPVRSAGPVSMSASTAVTASAPAPGPIA